MKGTEIVLGQAALQAPSRSLRVLGIDLGTTNSTVAELEWGPGAALEVARCVEVDQPTLEGVYTHVLLPSVVARHQEQEWVGEGAKRIRTRAPELGLKRGQHVFYETKNDIGLERTYGAAPDGLRNPAEVAARVMSFLMRSTTDPGTVPASDGVVVTVPASFLSNQRAETRRAAELAEIPLEEGGLLDEPVAAFIDYLMTHGAAAFSAMDGPKTLVVFDFGGGTCDVALFRLTPPSSSEARPGIASAGASRYHRLGGGDIDAAIVYEVLIPQFCEQNELDPKALSFDEKKRWLEPALLGIAENLKVGLCSEIRRLMKFGKYESADKSQVAKKQPGSYPCHLPSGERRLVTPLLSASTFEQLLEPFLDRELLYPRESEYRLTCSIFSPLEDAMHRADVDPTQVEYVLLVGGSCLIPQVAEAVAAYFPNASPLTYDDPVRIQTAAARGAAYQALSLTMSSRPVLQPVANDSVSIRTSSGAVALVDAGAELPHPTAGGYARNDQLRVPATEVAGSVPLQVSLVAGEGSRERKIFDETWEIPGPVSRGDALTLEFRYDENQVLDLRLSLASRPEIRFSDQVDHPLCHVMNATPARLESEKLEEQLSSGRVLHAERPGVLSKLGELSRELGQREKAVDYLVRALREKGTADTYLLNTLAGAYGDIGDWQREQKCYREAAEAGFSGAWFNLALSQRRQGQHPDALASARKALSHSREPAYVVLEAVLLRATGEVVEENDLDEILKSFGPIESQSDFELSWYRAGLEMKADADALSAVDAEFRKRRTGRQDDARTEGLLPERAAAIATRARREG